jgi:hypothetical protein
VLHWHMARVSDPYLPRGFKALDSVLKHSSLFPFDRHRPSLPLQLPTLPSHLAPSLPFSLSHHSSPIMNPSRSNRLFRNIVSVSSGPNVTKYCLFSAGGDSRPSTVEHMQVKSYFDYEGRVRDGTLLPDWDPPLGIGLFSTSFNTDPASAGYGCFSEYTEDVITLPLDGTPVPTIESVCRSSPVFLPGKRRRSR